MRIKKNISLRIFYLIQYQSLRTSIIRIVWRTVRRNTNEILGVKGLTHWYGVILQVKFTFTATDEFNASVSFTPTIKMCACENNGHCVKPAQGDKLNNDSKFIIQGCTCKPGYTGRFCENDIDACKVNGNPCFKGVTCNDTPAPANLTGFTCGACPPGYSGNGIKCAGKQICKLYFQIFAKFRSSRGRIRSVFYVPRS